MEKLAHDKNIKRHDPQLFSRLFLNWEYCQHIFLLRIYKKKMTICQCFYGYFLVWPLYYFGFDTIVLLSQGYIDCYFTLTLLSLFRYLFKTTSSMSVTSLSKYNGVLPSVSPLVFLCHFTPSFAYCLLHVLRFFFKCS